MEKTIYYIEDDANIRELVIYALKASGFQTIGFENARDFYRGIKSELPDLILLDVMLPDEDGISVLRKLKKDDKYKNIPVIMLTAKSTEYDKVIGLDQGADDYVTKPFGVMELVSRIKAVLRRSNENTQEEIITTGRLALNRKKHTVMVDDRPVELTYKEFELLDCLMKNKDLVMTREKLLDTVWNMDYECESRTVDVHIGMLRQKLGDAGSMIVTIRGVGYKLESRP